ncbi:uncharacterized protein LOC117119486 [Anneissia japonica]|uniref:uncharacterized protein LOC117119486 n=1 Tax=Anneissia japonica TaxID=1529436 RepID=UPI0014256AEE|nr:uncharacterized protein LOC117119486 [Anneissia japonica]
MGPVPKEERSEPSHGNKDDLLMEPGFAVMENDASDSDENSSDEDHADIVNQGYQLLSQDVDPIINEDCLLAAEASARVSDGQPKGDQSEISAQLAHVLPKETPKPDMSTVVTHTDSPESLKHRREIMASDDQIRAAMSGFSLPTASVPNWANFVQEKDWKTNLIQKIQKEGNGTDKKS